MEVNQASFRKELLPILKHISNASFISFDLEMSGIRVRDKNSAGDKSQDAGKNSLQQQYEEMKSAAETFQVLQIGITCVEEDREKNYYLARPFNFNLSPLTHPGIDLRLERTFQFSTSACDFLTKNSFDFGKVFRGGIPYLSRDEEVSMRDEYNSRLEKQANIPDLIIPENEPETLQFYNTSRETISKWVKDTAHLDTYVHIPNGEGKLNGYQRRLIYQLIRNEFPGFRVFPRNDGNFMQVQKLDREREDGHQQKKLEQFQSGINYQKGLRWVFEAMARGDISDIQPEWFVDSTSNKFDKELKAAKKELDGIKKNLRTKGRIIVGHNCFMDLCFLHKTFIGDLPGKVEHFQDIIHELFPIVMDTKYIATQAHDAMDQRSNLKDLMEPYKNVHFPLVLLHEDHMDYCSGYRKEHEAGYDSWMTAELFIRLSANLYAEHKRNLPHLYPRCAPSPPASDDSGSDSDTSSLDPDPYNSSPKSRSGGAPLFHRNPFSALESLPSTSLNDKKEKEVPRAYFGYMLNRNGTYKKLGDKDPVPLEKEQFLPNVEEQEAFWGLYRNKLRITGVEGGVCDLGEAEGRELEVECGDGDGGAEVEV